MAVDTTKPETNTNPASNKDKATNTVSTKTGDEKQEHTKTVVAGEEKKDQDTSASKNETIQAKEPLAVNVNARPGDIDIRSVIIKTAGGEEADITGLTVRFSIYENLFSPTLTGNILIADGIGAITALPITTFDRLELTLMSPAIDEKKIVFAISSIDGRKGRMEKQSVYTIHLISWEGYAAASKTFAKTYRGSYSEIAQALFTDHLTNIGGSDYPSKQLLSDSTENKGILYVPYWNVFKCMNYLANRAMPESGSTLPTYFFFETTNGFNFRPVENFYKCEPIQEFRYTLGGTQDGYMTGYGEGMKRIISMEIPKSFGGLDLVSRGCFGAIVWAKDINNEGVHQNEYKYSEYREKVKQYIGGDDAMKAPMNAFDSELEDPAVHRGYIQTTYVDNDVDDAMKYINWEVFRNVFITEITKLSIKIRVHGTLHLNVGDIVNVSIPDAATPICTVPEDDRHWSGRYFILSIHHDIVMPGKHTMVLQLAKNYFVWSPPTGPSENTENTATTDNTSNDSMTATTISEANKKAEKETREKLKAEGKSEEEINKIIEQNNKVAGELAAPASLENEPVGKDKADAAKAAQQQKLEQQGVTSKTAQDMAKTSNSTKPPEQQKKK